MPQARNGRFYAPSLIISGALGVAAASYFVPWNITAGAPDAPNAAELKMVVTSPLVPQLAPETPTPFVTRMELVRFESK